METELRQTQFSIERASDAIHWLDPEGRVLYANVAACRSLGYSHEEILSLSVSDFDPLVTHDSWREFWEQLKTQGSITFESVNETKNGVLIPVEVTSNYLEFDGRETTLHLYATSPTVNERNKPSAIRNVFCNRRSMPCHRR